MKVKMLTAYAGMTASCEPGGIIDLPEREARTRIANGEAMDLNDPRATRMVSQQSRAVTSVSSATPVAVAAAAPVEDRAPATSRRR